MLGEGNDASSGRGVGIILQDVGLLFRLWHAAKHFAADKIVHGFVGLVQPHALKLFRGQAVGFKMREDMG